jgi:hypothetical protein
MMQAALEAVSKPQKRLNNRYLEPGFEITSRNISTHLDTISPAAVFCGVCGRISEAFLPGTCLLLAATREGEIASGGGQSSSLQVDQDHLEMLAGEEAV